jgi:hypothetical protein
MIRLATASDIPAIAAMGKEFHAAAGWSDIFDYVEADCAASLGNLIQLDNFICLVAETDKIVGMAAGIISPVYFNHGHTSGEELFWYVAADAPQMAGIRLLAGLENAAKDMGCDSWQMKSIALLDGDKMAKLYERRGYRASENSFIKRL